MPRALAAMVVLLWVGACQSGPESRADSTMVARSGQQSTHATAGPMTGAPTSAAAPTDTRTVSAAGAAGTAGSTSGSAQGGHRMSFTLTSSAFTEGGAIPPKYTCEGEDVSPPLAWSGAPDGTRTYALIVDDPDAPDPAAPKMTYVHWVAYDIPASTNALGENASKKGMPSGAMQGSNDWHRQQYGGPCPPIGRHRYFFKLYALDTVLTGLTKPGKPDVESAMKGHVLAQAQLMGTYEKTKK